MKNVFIHPTAIVDEGAEIGEGSYIWHFAHIRSTAVLGNNVIVGKGSYIDSNVKIGNNSKIQNLVSIYDGVSIGNFVFVGPHVAFTNDIHPRIGFPWEITKTEIKDHVSIGANSTIVCGGILDEYSFIAAGTLIPAYRHIWKHALVMGNPGKIMGWVCKCGHKIAGIEKQGLHEIKCSNCKQENQIMMNSIGKLR